MNQPQNPRAATGFMLLASSMIASTTLLAKALGTDALGAALHPLQISQARFMFALIVIASAVAIIRPILVRPAWTTHGARTICGWAGVTLMFAASARIPLADATAISFLNPIFTMLLAILLLGERVGPWRWGAVAVAFTGGLILLRPGTGAIEAGALLALGAALVMGLEIIFIKQLSRREAPLPLMLVNNGFGFVISTIACLFVFMQPTFAQWAALVTIGVAMAGAQFCFVSAMARADASFSVPFTYMTLVFAALYDAAIFGVLPDIVSAMGAAIILTGALALLWRETIHKARSG